jgi:stage V sporulation protein AC
MEDKNLKPTNKEYEKLNKKLSPKTKSYKTIPMAFIFGGAICVIGQILADVYSNLGLDKEQSLATASLTLIVISAILTGLRLYDDIAKHAGAGTLVPITGFANAVVSPALEFKSEGFIMGTGAKLFVIAGPVIVYGITASVIYGIVIYIFNLV